MEETAPNLLTGVIDRFEGKMAVIRLADGQQINWPREKLSNELKEGSAVRLFISSSLTEDQERSKMAKTLLNEILKPSV